jgi:hypothetical protein
MDGCAHAAAVHKRIGFVTGPPNGALHLPLSASQLMCWCFGTSVYACVSVRLCLCACLPACLPVCVCVYIYILCAGRVCVHTCCFLRPPTWPKVVDMAKAPLRLKGHKKGGPTPLTRPLLCICNDPFAPHLRALREVGNLIWWKG